MDENWKQNDTNAGTHDDTHDDTRADTKITYNTMEHTHCEINSASKRSMLLRSGNIQLMRLETSCTNKKNENDNNQMVHQILKRVKTLKNHPKYIEMQTDKIYKLSDRELISLIVYTDSIKCCRKMKKWYGIRQSKSKSKSGKWNMLSHHLVTAINKMHLVFHYKNKDQIQLNKLYHGSTKGPLDQLSMEELFLRPFCSFSSELSVAAEFATASILVIDNAGDALRSGKLKGADVSWISKWSEHEYIILPTVLYKLKKIMKQKMVYISIDSDIKIRDGVNIYITNNYISNVDPLKPICDTLLPNVTDYNYNNFNQKNDGEYKDIKDWFEKLGLRKIDSKTYFDLFIGLGFYTFKKIKGIENSKDLNKIGIWKKGHIKKILKNIGLLPEYVQIVNEKQTKQSITLVKEIVEDDEYKDSETMRNGLGLRHRRMFQCSDDNCEWQHHGTIPESQLEPGRWDTQFCSDKDRQHIARFHSDLHIRVLHHKKSWGMKMNMNKYTAF